MSLHTQLFKGRLIYLGPINRDQDAGVEARWTQDSDYLQMLGVDLVRPLSPARVKKQYDEIEKDMDEKRNQYYFSIRRRENEEDGKRDELLGFARLTRIGWSHGTGSISLGIGDAAERGKGYGMEALNLMLRYAFRELNLFRLSASIPGYNQAALTMFQKAGFHEEARQREAYHLAGKRWDGIYMGLLSEEWSSQHGS